MMPKIASMNVRINSNASLSINVFDSYENEAGELVEDLFMPIFFNLEQPSIG